jgi:hypothetical protein
MLCRQQAMAEQQSGSLLGLKLVSPDGQFVIEMF